MFVYVVESSGKAPLNYLDIIDSLVGTLAFQILPTVFKMTCAKTLQFSNLVTFSKPSGEVPVYFRPEPPIREHRRKKKDLRARFPNLHWSGFKGKYEGLVTMLQKAYIHHTGLIFTLLHSSFLYIPAQTEINCAKTEGPCRHEEGVHMIKCEAGKAGCILVNTKSTSGEIQRVRLDKNTQNHPSSYLPLL